jgi:APA family basic amino acid/polyamine antiporter
MQTPRFARDMIVAVLALVFSILFIWYSRNTGHSFWAYWAPYFLAAVAPAARHPRLPGRAPPHEPS